MSEIITVTGNVATDPQQRTMRGDETVTSFRLAATQRRYDPQTSRWVDSYTNFYTVSAFRALGKNAYAALRRGQRVIVTGKVRVRDWDNGTKQGTSVDIDADGIGHDLLFGVTTLERSGAPAASHAHAAPGADAPDAASSAEAWDVPAMAEDAAPADAPF